MSFKLFAAALPLVLLPALAQAAQPTRTAQFDDWGVYSYASGDGTACYALSVPKKMAPAGVDHGRNYFIIAPGAGATYVPQAVVGYALQPNSDVNIHIGARDFAMFVRDNTAWARSEGEQPQIVAAMQAGAEMIVAATSRRGTETTYAYSLTGVSAALKQVAKCR